MARTRAMHFGEANHLVVALPRGNHGVAVFVPAHRHIHQHGAVVGQHSRHCGTKLGGVAQYHALNAVGLSQQLKVGHPHLHVGGGVALAVEGLLPLADHALPAIVNDHGFDGNAILGQGTQLL